MQIDMYNTKGDVVGSVDLNDSIFGVEVNEALVHEAVMTQKANARVVLAHVKDRSEVRGGGKKPWRQKGTGRARHGSSRSPIWIGGGVTFGPNRLRNFSRKMNRKARRKAMFMTLSDKVANKAFLVIDSLEMEGKTKEVAALLKALPRQGKRTLLVTKPENVSVRRAAQNMFFTQGIAPNSLNVVDILKAGTIIIGKEELETLTQHFVKA
ncbi:50S ribosomal protein L4 [Candidatus Uhrbacteria bacterium CG10_big_fil_rev_8_21_14_0_10_50_16]|uniref:Large ribosomal subunit protein uL4 n=1 Tax=Candidatus Uhrbacteria bacterium CG10_big_fil_rev_8_21_14_0_10_50_16 TaxID=1975039 RepID=A0A2H0RM58_9BACT|nr:MAG: 50S ribosomal protein L4 [Candidatus Uhrbacteria bacterium CG10_big_fil_rev_8_21_14_0_10_50_16]